MIDIRVLATIKKADMKQLYILILLTLFFSSSLRAEYTAHRLQLKIITTEKEYIGYVEIPHLNFELTNDLSYLKIRLPHKENPDGSFTDSIYFYETRVDYKRKDLSNNTGSAYATTILINPILLHTDSIIAIEIINKEKYFYGTAIISNVHISDTTWLKESPKKEILIEGFICGYEIFIHKSSLEADSIINKMIEIRSRYLSEFEELTDENKNGGYVGDDMDAELRIEINKLIKLSLKIVVIESCMC